MGRSVHLAIFSLLLVALSTPCVGAAQSAQTKAAGGPTVGTSLARIRIARTRVEAYVIAVKSQFKSDDPAYKKLMSDYIDAYSKYDGWTTALRNAIVTGKTKDLTNDGDYKQIADDASTAAQKFVDDAVEATQQPPTRSVATVQVLSALADLGIKIWTGYVKGRQDQRQQYADFVSSEIKWRDWTIVSASSTDQPAKPASGASPADQPAKGDSSTSSTDQSGKAASPTPTKSAPQTSSPAPPNQPKK